MDSHYKTEKVNDFCTAIEDKGVRCFLMEGGERALLVDTGFGTGDLPTLVAGLTQLPVTLLNTHADRDHVGGNAGFSDVYMHPAEYDRYRLRAKGDMRRVHPVWEGDVLDLGGMRLRVVLIPGHTPGSIALLEEEKGMLWGGDTVQNGEIFMFGPGRNLPAFVESLKRLEALPFETVYPSHAALPLERAFLPRLRAEAEAILAGERESTAGEKHGQPVAVYKSEVATFLCDPE